MVDTRKILDMLGAAERMWEKAPASVPAQNVVALAGVYAQLAQVEVMHSIAVSLAALVELGGRPMIDTIGDGDFTDEQGELPY